MFENVLNELLKKLINRINFLFLDYKKVESEKGYFYITIVIFFSIMW